LGNQAEPRSQQHCRRYGWRKCEKILEGSYGMGFLPV